MRSEYSQALIRVLQVNVAVNVALRTVSSVLSKACDGGLVPLCVSFVSKLPNEFRVLRTAEVSS